MQLVALLLAVAGTLLLLWGSIELGPATVRGDLFCLAAGLLYTGYLIGVERGRKTLEPIPLLTWASGFAAQWFQRGRLTVLDGAAKGLSRRILSDEVFDTDRVLILSEEIGAGVAPGAASRAPRSRRWRSRAAADWFSARSTRASSTSHVVQRSPSMAFS